MSFSRGWSPADVMNPHNRYLSVEKSRSVYVRLFPEPGRLAKEQPPLARFVLRVSWVGPPRRSSVSPGLLLQVLCYTSPIGK